MSDAINFHFVYPQTPSHPSTNHIRKQQSTSKLINTYLSTAAQYLNRTKSFHISTNATLRPKKSICIQVDNNSPEKRSSLCNNPNLARSVPSNINNLNLSLVSTNTHMIYHEQQFQSIGMSEVNTNKESKSPGFVNTIRRSLRKNKERFYNKRSVTMKSCHSLSQYEETPVILPQTSMTPTLLCRRQYSDKTHEAFTTTPTGETSTNFTSLDDDNEDESERNDQMPPLQSLGQNGNSRLLSYSPITPSSSFIQQTTVLPKAPSVQSLAVPTSESLTADHLEKERLKNDLLQLKNELQKSKETIARLQKSEEQMRERLAEQAQRQLEKGGKFEDLNQISRPTELIRSFNTLYSQLRIDALDALDSIRELSSADDLKSKLLFSVVVLAFRHAQNHAKDVRNKIKQLLQLSNDKGSIVLEETIEKYLRTTIQKYDVGKIISEVENQLWNTLYDYPRLKTCHELLKYIHAACRTAWGLVNQTPPYSIEFQTTKYDKSLHERFHTSDKESETIIEYIWPCLIDGRDRTCVAKGVVLTEDRLSSLSKNLSC
ncbi:unnamed protein product [Adineta ricciae]|uniref:Mitochondria-eating protein n=1 Tax=Adineta ricciae TaxID=249248 RepID=A0A814D8M9_ADIRI|nr:unnamed protein product [Adineta ricciae]CAF1267942.1 unnamed protein product [Adineta ricciae]